MFTRIHLSILTLCIGLIIPAIHAMEKGIQSIETTAISFDLDGVLSGSIAIPDSDTELRNLTQLRQRHTLLNNALDNNAHLEDKFTHELAQEDPFLIVQVQPIIDLIVELKRKGYTVVAATNQDHYNHTWYRKTFLDAHNIDFQNLFDATLTTDTYENAMTYPNECLDCIGLAFCYEWLTGQSRFYSVHHAAEQIYTTNDYSIRKPKKHYYQALEHLVRRKNPNVTKIIHIDDIDTNILGALYYGIDAIHFNVDVLNAEAATLAAAITKLKKDLKRHGVHCD